jgi:formylglycine-generating enzyme required for sulfatase activity
MGSEKERPMKKVKIDKPFWMGTTEVSLAQYQQFRPGYKNGVYDMHYKDQVNRGYYVNEPNFPVIRVPYTDAEEFCRWLEPKVGHKVALPTEEQWEWACRAGSGSLLSFGDKDTDFSAYANLADATLIKLAVKGVNPQPIKDPTPEYDYELKDTRFDDGVLHLAEVGKYQPNVWGLYDMHGNVCEWTRSDYDAERKVVRGGSWKDRQDRAASAFRIGYPTWQQVYNTGFRVIIAE